MDNAPQAPLQIGDLTRAAKSGAGGNGDASRTEEALIKTCDLRGSPRSGRTLMTGVDGRHKERRQVITPDTCASITMIMCGYCDGIA